MDVNFDLQRHLHDMERRIVSRIDEGRDDMKALDARVGKLEDWRNYLAGAWMVVAGGVAYMFKK